MCEISLEIFKGLCYCRTRFEHPTNRVFSILAAQGNEMLDDFGYIAIFLIFAAALPVSMMLLPWMLTQVGIKPHRPNKVKNDTYECGMPTIGGSWVRFNFRYYFYALLFVVFDVTVVFIFPWAVQIRELAWTGLTAMLVFITILSVGLVYAWRKKALEWR